VPDVMANFSDVVEVVKSPEEFISHCEACILNPDDERILRGLALARENTWESIVAQLKRHIQDALVRKAGAVSSPAHYVDLNAMGGINLPLSVHD